MGVIPGSLTSLLSRDDWIYTAILLLSFGLGLLIRSSGNIQLLKNACGTIGFAMALVVLGKKIIYSIILAAFAAICIKFIKNQLTTVVFVGTFVYLMILRNLHYILDVDELASQSNVVQLILTLRVIGLAFEVSDSRINKDKPTNKEPKPKRYISYEPTFFEIFDYFYHFAGLFTGPYYTFQMYLDSHNETIFYHWSPTPEIKYRLLRLLWSVPIFVGVNKLYPLDAHMKWNAQGLRSDAVWDMTFIERIIYAAAVFVVFRMRVYSAWAIAESICVTLGLGIYPTDSEPKCVVGPTKLDPFKVLHGKKNIEYNSEAIVNLDIYQIETSDGFRAGIRSWNRSVQSWLALYVHSRANRLYRVELTMFVSALWHGTYAGYFMSFLIVPMCAAVEDILFSYFPVDKETGTRPQWFRWLYFFTLRSRGFDMLATGFLLKNFADTHRYWSSLYYWLLLVTLPIYVSHKIYVMSKKKSEKKDKKLN